MFIIYICIYIYIYIYTFFKKNQRPEFKCPGFEWFSSSEGITPNPGLTGPNNTTYIYTYIYIYIYIYIYHNNVSCH